MARVNGKNTKGKKGRKNIVDKKSETTNGDIKGIIYIAVGILLAVAIYTSWAGALSVFAKKIIYNLIGVGAFILPAFLIYFGVDSIISKGSIKFSRRLVGTTLVVLMLILLCATTKLNTTDNVGSFGESLKKIMISDGEIHGGFFGHLMAYPLSKMLGFIGAYVLYIAVGSIGTILVFDITLYDIIMYFKGDVSEEKKIKASKKEYNSEELEVKKKKVKSDFIDVVPKDKKRDEFIQGINNKIKILDFIKSSSLDDDKTMEEVAVEGDKNNPFNIEIYEEGKVGASTINRSCR